MAEGVIDPPRLVIVAGTSFGADKTTLEEAVADHLAQTSHTVQFIRKW